MACGEILLAICQKAAPFEADSGFTQSDPNYYLGLSRLPPALAIGSLQNNCAIIFELIRLSNSKKGEVGLLSPRRKVFNGNV